MLATTVLLASGIVVPDCPPPATWLDRTLTREERGWATREEKADVRARMVRTWKAAGASRDAVQVLLEQVERESFNGDACSVHVRGPGEYGLGPGGLSVSWQLRRWGGDDERVLYVPEVSALVMLRLARSSLRFGASSTAAAGTWLRYQQVYAGRFEEQDPWRDERWCARLRGRGVDCRAKIGSQLGALHGGGRLHAGPSEGQVAFVVELQTEAGVQ